MNLYQALYRKYRSENFEQIAGQEPIVATLKNAIKNNKISHAYLFSGPRGTGKTSIAKILAKTVNCENLNGFLPCDKCQSCIQTLHKQNTDIVEIDAASNNGVDEIRELKNKINLVPTYGKYKVYIIDEVHMLTISAFNALLKTLEEPPSHIIFILATTEPHKIPATIISRCQRFDFKRIPEESIVNRLKFICEKENIICEEEALHEIARLSDGGMRDAISLLDQTYSYADEKITVKDIHEVNGSVSQYDLKDFFDNYCKHDLNYLLKKIEDYTDNGKNLVKVAEELLLFLRNVLIYKKVPKFLEENNIPTENYKVISESLETASLLKLIKELNDSIPSMKISSNPRLNLELTFIKMMEEDTCQSVSEKNIVKTKIEEKVVEHIPSKSIENSELNQPATENISREIKKSISNEKKMLRINNTLATFDKRLLMELREKVIHVKNLLLDTQYSQFVSLILDGSLRASGKKNLIFVFRTNQDAVYFNENLVKIEEILEKVLQTSYKAIAVNAEEWEEIKREFNGKQKQYSYIEEKEEEKKTEEQLDSVQQLFHNIIEYI